MFLVLHKRGIIKSIAFFMISIALIICFAFNAPLIQETMANKRLVPIYKVATEEKLVAISFDAAWGADKTQDIIDILLQHEARATFFLVGFWIEKYPEMVKKIHDSGLTIGNHSNNHLKMSALAEDEMKKEITTVNQMIFELTDNYPKLFRAPFGDYNNLLCQSVTDLNMMTIQWDVDSLDWKGLSGKEIADRVIARVEAGSIILCHNNSDHIVEALPIILLSLKNKGFKIVAIEELVYEDDYYIDSAGVQRLNPNL